MIWRINKNINLSLIADNFQLPFSLNIHSLSPSQRYKKKGDDNDDFDMLLNIELLLKVIASLMEFFCLLSFLEFESYWIQSIVWLPVTVLMFVRPSVHPSIHLTIHIHLSLCHFVFVQKGYNKLSIIIQINYTIMFNLC